MSESNNFAYIVALEAERDFWQESSGQNYVRAQDAEDREKKLKRRIEEFGVLHAELEIEYTKAQEHNADLEAAIKRHKAETMSAPTADPRDYMEVCEDLWSVLEKAAPHSQGG